MSAAERKKSVVLLSGGLDSAANLALCRELDEPVLALTVDYGQRAARAEIVAARRLCEHYRVPHETVSIPWLGRLGGSSLTDERACVPSIESAQLDNLAITLQTARCVWVPNRNGVLINIAGAYAERLGAEQVVVGFNREEAATFPDNSGEFLKRATAALALSSANAVRVVSYTTELDKTQIVARVSRLGPGVPAFPFEQVWSCYQGGERPCGACESCRRFERAVGRRG